MFGKSSILPPGLGLDSLEGARNRRGILPRGLFGSSNPFRATPEQEEESRRMAGILGVPDSRQSVSSPTGAAVPPQHNGPSLSDMVGPEPQRPDNFWQGGRKFGVRDGLAGALAVLGDAFTQQAGGRGGAVNNLAGQRQQGMEAMDNALAQYARSKQVAGLPGMTAREFAAFQMDPKAWGSHNSDALSTHHAAANVSPGEQRVFGNPVMGGSVYQAPTAAEQYAGALGEATGTPQYRTALQDYVLRGSGPTAFNYDTQLDDHQYQNDLSLEGVRQRNRIGMEGVRQNNRTSLRGMPTYRDLNPPAPRGGGGRENIPTVRSPAEARGLPSGTKFRTPDGRVKVVP